MKGEAQFRIVGTVTLGPKGQVVIPADVREEMGITPGDKLIAMEVCKPGGRVSIAFITESQAQAIVDHLGDQVMGLRQALNEQS